MATISSAITFGITLATSGVYASPLTITGSGAVESGSGDAIYGPNTQAWTVSNAGTVEATGSGDGVDLRLGGSVANSGLIDGLSRGVYITGGIGVLSNLGTVSSSDYGVWLKGGGGVTNGQSGSTIGLISGTFDAVVISATAGTATNFGSIASTSGDGVGLTAGGKVSNGPSASITANVNAVYVIGGLGTVSNLGTVSSSNKFGVWLVTGGSVTNGQSGSTFGLISGRTDAVVISATAGTATNFGAITSALGDGVALTAGGNVTNGASASITANVAAIYVNGGLGTVSNLGTVSAASKYGVWLVTGGSVTNGQNGSTAGRISGGLYGVEIAGTTGTVTNFGTVAGTNVGAYLKAGGGVTNGHSGSTVGLLTGAERGVLVKGTTGTVANFATISAANSTGVYLMAGGDVTNGQGSSSSGLITGRVVGIAVAGATGTITNDGTVTASPLESISVGVFLGAGGSVTNGQSGSSAALISGEQHGIFIALDPGTVSNFGSVISNFGGDGIRLTGGGSVTNGGSGSLGAVISGSTGVYVSNAPGAVTNFGMIYGGVSLLAGGSVVIARYGLISGAPGISITGGAGTVTDSGAVVGSGGTAIQFGTFNDTLILDTTASFVGKVDGGVGTNTLELRAGATAGTLSALGTGFVNFGHVVIDPIANWTVEFGAPTVGQTIVGSGGSNRLVFKSAGTIDLSGVSGFPTIVLSDFGANTATLGNANFIGLSSPVITVIGGNIGNTLDASALTSTNGVILVGGVRTDHFTGGAGNDVFKFSAANLAATDKVVGGAGSDELLMTSAGTINAGGVSGVENVQLASGAANSLTLTSANFTGVASGKITITDGNSGNIVSAATLPSSDAIIVHAGTGTDTLKGGAGGDIFYAGGKTKMTGGGGANRFTFADIGANSVTDFAASSANMIVLRDSGFNLGVDEGLGTGSAKHLAASVFVANSTGSFTTTGQRFAYNTTTGALRYDKDGSGASFSASTVVVLSGHPSLSAGASGKIFFTS